MAIEKQVISAVPDNQEAIELEITPETEEETELFVQPDGSIVQAYHYPEQ